MNLLFLNTRGCIMKKLAIVALALVLAMTFVGCSVLTETVCKNEICKFYKTKKEFEKGNKK